MKINLNKTKDLLERLPRILAENSFFVSLIFIFIAFIVGGFVFYKYSILAEKIEPQIIGTSLQFKEKTYQEILTEWQERESKFEAADSKQYLNPFQGPQELTK